MRLWSMHPAYIDSKGIVAFWREGLLAKKVLEGKSRGYKNHSQLVRFKKCADPILTMNVYLKDVLKEAGKMGYSFNSTKIELGLKSAKIPVTKGQIVYEAEHLKNKLMLPDPLRHKKMIDNESKDSQVLPHPLLRLIEGKVEQWEKVNERKEGG